MENAPFLILFPILREFVEKTSVFLDLHGHFVEKCNVFLAFGFEGPLQGRSQDVVGDVALLMLLPTPSEFGEKLVFFFTATSI